MKPIIKIVIIIAVVLIVLTAVVTQRFLSSRTENPSFLEATKIVEEGAQLSDYRREGYDIYEKSKIKGYVLQGDTLHYKGEQIEGFHEVEDYCYQDHSKNPSFKGNGLKEYFVGSWKLGSKKFHNVLSFLDRECNCVDGACVKPAPVSSCTETDDGKDIYTRGKITGIRKNEDFISEFEDSCSEGEYGSMLLEGFCMEGMTYYSDWIPCEAGCEAGRCLKGIPDFLPAGWPLDKCYDSDGGENYYIKGESYGDYVGDVFDTFVVKRDRCFDENQLNETFCINDKQSSGIGVKCSCVDGICLK